MASRTFKGLWSLSCSNSSNRTCKSGWNIEQTNLCRISRNQGHLFIVLQNVSKIITCHPSGHWPSVLGIVGNWSLSGISCIYAIIWTEMLTSCEIMYIIYIYKKLLVQTCISSGDKSQLAENLCLTTFISGPLILHSRCKCMRLETQVTTRIGMEQGLPADVVHGPCQRPWKKILPLEQHHEPGLTWRNLRAFFFRILINLPWVASPFHLNPWMIWTQTESLDAGIANDLLAIGNPHCECGLCCLHVFRHSQAGCSRQV